MTWVMEEDTQASVRENRGWKEGENDLFMKENYIAFTSLNWLDQNPIFPLTLFKKGGIGNTSSIRL